MMIWSANTADRSAAHTHTQMRDVCAPACDAIFCQKRKYPLDVRGLCAGLFEVYCRCEFEIIMVGLFYDRAHSTKHTHSLELGHYLTTAAAAARC